MNTANLIRRPSPDRPSSRGGRGTLWSPSRLGRLAIGAGALLLSACGAATSAGTPIPGSAPLLPATAPVATPSLAPTPAPSPVPLPAYQAGVDLLFYADAGYKSGLSQLLAELRRDGVNSVAITFPFYQASLTASSVGSGSGTPPDSQLEGLIDSVEAAGFSVMLRPLEDQTSLAPEWRGAIAPASVSAWFSSYTTLISHYATIAANTHVQVLDVGSELYSLEGYTTDWQNLISAVRLAYGGAVTYSVNGTSETSGSLRDGFWKALDFVSVDAYWDLGVANGTGVAGMAQAWQPYLAAIDQAAAGARVVISEVGVAPQQGEQDHPWDSQAPGPTDQAFQAQYYQAACQAATAASVSGIYWWEVNLGTKGDFDPLGNPAEVSMAACFLTAAEPAA